jgi:predicted secreted acid phosphatase
MTSLLRAPAAALALVVAASLGIPAAAQSVAPPTCPAPPCTAPIASSQLPNLGQVKHEIETYYEDGSYAAEVQTIEADAQRYLDQRVQAGARKPALVLDIDDTALSSYVYEKAHDFGYDPVSWNAQAATGFPAIAPTLALARHAEAEHIAVLFVTGRRTGQDGITRANLLGVGYPVDGLYLRPPDDHAPSVVPFKSSARAAIETQGYTVLETIGDQWSDLEGGHAERAYKLPNPMYFLP